MSQFNLKRMFVILGMVCFSLTLLRQPLRLLFTDTKIARTFFAPFEWWVWLFGFDPDMIHAWDLKPSEPIGYFALYFTGAVAMFVCSFLMAITIFSLGIALWTWSAETTKTPEDGV